MYFGLKGSNEKRAYLMASIIGSVRSRSTKNTWPLFINGLSITAHIWIFLPLTGQHPFNSLGAAIPKNTKIPFLSPLSSST